MNENTQPELPSIDGLIAKLTADRDAAIEESRGLRTQIAMHKAAAEADQSRIVDLESRANAAVLARDQAVADRVKYEALFVTVRAMLRAFNVPSAPLIIDKSEAADHALEQQQSQIARQQAVADNYHPHPLYAAASNVGHRTDAVPQHPRSS